MRKQSKTYLIANPVSIMFCVFLLAFVGEARPTVNITVAENGWGAGKSGDIKKVLESVAQEITAHISSINNISILVEPSKDGFPRTLYRKGRNGEFIVLLSARDRYWAQFSYQFGHELAHVLTINKTTSQTPNQWFEESLGEASSLYALRAMTKTWQISPPYPHWKTYAPHLDTYAKNLINEQTRRLPQNTTFVQWFGSNEISLMKNPYLRPKNALIANRLLAFFENYPEGWEAISYINQTKPDDSQTFEEYLGDWHNAAPPRHKAFVKRIAAFFGRKIG